MKMKLVIRQILWVVTTVVVLALFLYVSRFIRLFATFAWVMFELPAHLRIIEDVEQQMGFAHETPYQDGREISIITHVRPGGPMHKAGIRVGDHIRLCSTDSLYKRLALGQGKKVIIPVRRGRQNLEVTVQVPKLILRDNPWLLHWLGCKCIVWRPQHEWVIIGW